MKTLTILFESPNVFYAVIDGVNIRIDNPKILMITDYADYSLRYVGQHKTPNVEVLKHGDIFQVEGFEYELDENYDNICDVMCIHCNHHDIPCKKSEKVAILKLAKEEEPKEKIYTIDEVIHKLRLGLSEYGKKSGIAGYWVLEDNVYYILNKLKK